MDPEEREMFHTLGEDIKAIKDAVVPFMAEHEVRVTMNEDAIKQMKPTIKANELFRNGALAIVTFVTALAALHAYLPKFFGH